MLLTDTNPFNILYIEDDKLSREITSHLLRKLCAELVVAEDGLDGFIKFKLNSIDLIITDLSMPKINGIDFIKMIRNINQEIPIIILSAYIDNKLLEKSINYGIQGYLKKPISKIVLESKIKSIKANEHKKSLLNECHNITNRSTIISKINKSGITTYVNDTYCKVSGYNKEELLGKEHLLISLKEESPSFFKSIWNQISNKKKMWSGVLKHRTKNNVLYYLKTTIQPIIDVNGEIEQFITLSVPITEVIHPQEQLQDHLQQHNKSTVLLIKIEEFKYLKHSFSKKLQTLFAKELLKHMPIECNFSNIYILTNGKFAFIKEYDQSFDKDKINNILKTFQKNVNQANFKTGILDYTLSIVYSLAYGKDAFDNAKIGLGKILQSKEDSIIAEDFLEIATKSSAEKLNKFTMLKEAIASYNIVSHFQPIVDNKTKKIIKYESLVRLIDKDKKTITPYHFLDIAKEGKYYHHITSIVLRNSFRALFNTDIEVSINLSALDMEDQRIQGEFFNLLNKYRTEAHRITIELVEDEKIKDEKSIQKFIQEIKKYGIKIALDDFGKGLSNFARIKSYNPDYIKIDGSLIRNIENDKFSKDLVETIVFFAKRQNIKTIAEFVENENIYYILKELGVDYSQGYYFSKAALLKEFIPSSL